MYHNKKPKKNPSYKFSDFKKACRKNNRNNILIIYNVPQDAAKHFNLRTNNEILDFIYSGGLKNKIFKNSTVWKQNPDKQYIPIMIDSYEFTTGKKRGYIAFMCDKFNNWVIKSFHLAKRKK